ncbi:MAG: glutaredoxin family protein [Rhodocyclaceae bacterium]|nr:glutaredoxin family protein [Rhodocyclaceae bacterium]
MKKSLIALVLLMSAPLASAETVYRWVDKEGGTHYTDRPPLPAEAKSFEQKGIRAPGADSEKPLPYEARKAAENFPVTVHSTPDCVDACKQGRDHLAKRGVPFTEKSVATPEDIAALRTLVGEGQLLVPVLQVGGKVVRGFRQADWDGLLDATGYPKAGNKQP